MRNERDLLVDTLERLNRLRVPYMLVGSMASNVWGIPRSTHDLDFVLLIKPEDVADLAAAFADDFFLQVESIRRAFAPPHLFNMIDEKSALKIDFWLLHDNAFERAAFARRTLVRLFSTPAWVTTAEDVILHKLYWHRLTPSDRQLSDAASVYKIRGNQLDLTYMHQWAAALDVGPEFEGLLAGEYGPKNT